jgi:3-methyladenine DNA glycosylase AlkD
MNYETVINEIKSYENLNGKKVLSRHGAKEPFYGVKIQDLKKIKKKIKIDFELSLRLYESGISDAMYLAGLITDPKKMSKEILDEWVKKAYWYMLSEYTVAGVTAKSDYGMELGLNWIKSDSELIASCGWATVSNVSTIKQDSDIDLSLIKDLLLIVKQNIHSEKNRVRYTMNNYVICIGIYVKELSSYAIEIAKSIGDVNVDMGNTSCKVPNALEYIDKAISKGKLGKKRKTAIC